MINITVSVDEQVVERARRAAQAMGKSLDQAVRDYLERLGGASQRTAGARAFEASARATPGRLAGWRFDRDDTQRRR
jgi:hypothetical protein